MTAPRAEAIAELMAAAKAFDDDLSEYCDGEPRDRLRAALAVLHSAIPEPAQIRIMEALAALVCKMEEVHADPAFRAVWDISHIHIGPYRGPTYAVELENAKAALECTLTSTEPASLPYLLNEKTIEFSNFVSALETTIRTLTALAENARAALSPPSTPKTMSGNEER